MKKLKPARRSVSPFGTVLVESVDPLSLLKDKIQLIWKSPSEKPILETLQDANNLPYFIEKVLHAPANDLGGIESLCNYLVRFRVDFDQASLGDDIFSAMEHVFNTKTEDFFLADSVLYSKERDALIGRYFIPVTEQSPGQFSGFLSRWIETDRLDRLLHFFDFSKGSTNPTFEYYLVFANPSFHRVLTNKTLLRSLLYKVEPLMKKLPSAEWEKEVKSALQI